MKYSRDGCMEILGKIAKDDCQRKIVYCLKVAVTLTLLSILVYVQTLYNEYKDATTTIVLTVLSVLEFTVGETLSKCVNTTCSTLAGGLLGVGVVYLARFCRNGGEPVFMGIAIFILALLSVFARFSPCMKSRYAGSASTFIVTFATTIYSGYRVDKIWLLACQRLATFVIGSVVCVIMSLVIYPVWAGEDLHVFVAENLEKLAKSLDGNEDSLNENCQSVLDSKAKESSLINNAWWEGGLRFCQPCEQYSKVCDYSRDCACLIKELNKLKPTTSEIQQACLKKSADLNTTLKELAAAIRNGSSPSSTTESPIHNTKANLNNVLESSLVPVKSELHEMVSLLILVAKCTNEISIAVHELCTVEPITWGFKDLTQLFGLHLGVVVPVDDDISENSDHDTIDISPVCDQNSLPNIGDHAININNIDDQDSLGNRSDITIDMPDVAEQDSLDNTSDHTIDILNNDDQDLVSSRYDHTIDIGDIAQDLQTNRECQTRARAHFISNFRHIIHFLFCLGEGHIIHSYVERCPQV